MISKSLVVRLKLLTALWLASTLFSITFTLVLSWRLEGGAAAINDTGGLRKQTYHLVLLIAKETSQRTIDEKFHEFEKTLQTLKKGDPLRPLFLPNDANVRQLLADVEQTWQQQINPHFQAAYQNHGALNREKIDTFINKIEMLTRAIEKINSKYINWLRAFQFSLMIFTIIAVFVIVILLYSWIINPLQKLQIALNEVHSGKIGIQVPVENLTEFAALDTGFNRMSAHLQELYGNLEQQVSDKTHDLEQKNYTLQTLYFFSHFLNQAQTATEASQVFLEKIIELVPAQAGSIRLIDLKRQRLDLIAHVRLPEHLQTAEACQRIDSLCGQTVQQPEWQPIFFHKAGARAVEIHETTCHQLGFNYLRVFKIRYNAQDLGIMALYFNEEYNFNNLADLLDSLCYQLGSAVSNIRLAEESRQLAVMQERNLMAQGLHDSIAQTLTFLNLQVQMLESALNAKEQEQAEENLQFIKDGVQECYEDVRELLLNFRTKITRKEFSEAVETLTQRFEQQTHVRTNVQWQGNGLPLSSEQQLQFIFILQESLSNVRKHAHAQNVQITFENYDDFSMTIEDDGQGFDLARLENLSGSHVGLNIMRERALRIHAHFEIKSALQEHTVIHLTLPKKERVLE
ncbi:histidine kinase [Kingella negevensis]|uniref:Sensor protein n=1 Tax=Kingella negevensis TaxID=1522312 RepID=A0A238HHX8_9NEIS|nr:histidine kinase [Kingella negevensis]SNB72928.1 Nitrate/nitrite sensor protein NarX [Kingella negevensis]